MTTLQIIQAIATLVLAIDLTLVTVYLVLLIRDLRTTAREANRTVADVRRITETVVSPVIMVAGILENVARGTKIFKQVSSIFEKKQEEK